MYFNVGHWIDLQYLPRSSEKLSTLTMFSHHPAFFSCPEHLGVILNTDGISVFKSSRTTVWLQIANLPPELRFRQDNNIVAGLWVGESKPNMEIILSPILKKIDCLNSVGVSFSAHDSLQTVRIKPLFGVFDLIAKALVLNIKQFNGSHVYIQEGNIKDVEYILPTEFIHTEH